MIGLLSKLFGGNKSQKDIKVLSPVVEKVSTHFTQFREISNDELRGKTVEFRQRIATHLQGIDEAIESQKQEAEQLPIDDISGRDGIYQQIDKLKKERDEQIEVILNE